MKRFKLFTLVLVALAFFVAAPAQAALQDMWADVYTWDGKQSADGKPTLTLQTSGITFKVLVINSDTAETLYYPSYSAAMTSLTNPVTTTNFASDTVCHDKVAFKVDPTDSTSDRYVDLIVVDTNGGYSTFVENFDKYNHTIVIDERPNILHQGTIWFGASSTSEINTGVQFLTGTMIEDVRVEVVTVASGVTLDVGTLSTGTSGDANGFRVGVLLTTAGYVEDTAFITSGASIDYYPVSTYGVLLAKAVTGAGETFSDNGGKTPLKHFVTGAESAFLCYTNPSTTGAGYIHYWFNRIR